MKMILILLALMLVSISCTKKSEELQLVIENKTDNIIDVNLGRGWVYPASDFGGVHLESEFNLSPNEPRTLYYSKDLKTKPHELAAKLFNVINIGTNNNITITFTHNTVTGYSENIFSENSTWNLRMEEYSMCHPNRRVTVHCYYFVISEENFVTNSEK
jgi:hypothetical protein